MASPLIKFIESVCVQWAFYWNSVTGVNDGFGNITYPPPVIVKCRWDGKVQLIKNDKGEEVVSHAEVLVPVDLPVGGVLQLLGEGNTVTMVAGTPDDIIGDDYRILGLTVVWETDMPTPESPVDGQPIIASVKVPLFRSTTDFVRTVYV
jgi:hypothetical protein